MKVDLYISNEQPKIRTGAWLKPVSGGYALYVIEGGSARVLELVDNNGTVTTIDDVADDIKAKADKVKNSTNGHLAALNSKGNLTDSGKSLSDLALLGTPQDPSTDMTLYGLKAYIDSKG